MKSPKTGPDQFNREESACHFQQTLRGALVTPHQPHAEEKKPAAKKPAAGKVKNR